MTNQMSSDWGEPEWGAKPRGSGGPASAATGTAQRGEPSQQGDRPVTGGGPLIDTREPPSTLERGNQPRPRKKRRVLSGVLFVLLSLMALVILGFVLLVMWVVSMAQGPIEATNSFVAELDEGQISTAYDSMCAEAKSTYSLDEFTSHMANSTAISGYTFVSASVRANSQTIVSGTIEVDDVPQAADFGLLEEGGSWKVCSYPLLD